MPNNNKPPIPPPRPSKTSVQQDNTRQNNPIYGIAPNESKELYATVNKPKKHDSREQGILYAELSHGESSSSRLPETDNKATYASISVKDGKTEVGPVLPERNYRPEETKPRVPNRSTAFNVNDKVPSPPSRTTSLDNARSSAEKRPTEKENKSFLHRFMKKCGSIVRRARR